MVLSLLSRKALDRLVKSDLAWQVLEMTLMKASGYARNRRNQIVAGDFETAYKEIIRPAIIVSGPFRGMKYHRGIVAKRAGFSKVVGSYESELRGFLEEALRREYRNVVNVGCAEGYYAVGMAWRQPTARVLAFDIDPGARSLCAAMALANGVGERVRILSEFSWGAFAEVEEQGGLFITDCEGYEDQLLSAEAVPHLLMWDVLVETHDHLVPGVGGRVQQRFANTHEIERIGSVDDFVKAQSCQVEALSKYSYATKLLMMSEGRGHRQEWLVLRSKARTATSSGGSLAVER